MRRCSADGRPSLPKCGGTRSTTAFSTRRGRRDPPDHHVSPRRGCFPLGLFRSLHGWQGRTSIACVLAQAFGDRLHASGKPAPHRVLCACRSRPAVTDPVRQGKILARRHDGRKDCDFQRCPWWPGVRSFMAWCLTRSAELLEHSRPGGCDARGGRRPEGAARNESTFLRTRAAKTRP